LVALVIFNQASRLSQTEDHDAARQRIQRAGVANPPFPAPAPDFLHNVMAGRQPGRRWFMQGGRCLAKGKARLIDNEQAMKMARFG
jgi:hypothetical protein